MTPASLRRSGPVLLTVSALLFGVMAVMTKRAAALGVPGPEVALVRFAVGVLGSLAWVVLTGRPLRPVNRMALAARGIFGGLAVLGFFVAIWKLPVGVATLLNYTSPVATAIFAALFLRERLTLATVAALGLTSAGVVLVVNANAPGGGGLVGRLGFGPWELVGVASALMAGAAVTSIRWARRTDGPWEVFAAFSLIGAAICAPPAVWLWVTPSPLAWALMIGVGVVSIAAQLLFIYALRFTAAAPAGVISQLTPVTAMALGVVLFGDPIGPQAIAGTALTLVGVGWSAVRAAQSGG